MASAVTAPSFPPNVTKIHCGPAERELGMQPLACCVVEASASASHGARVGNWGRGQGTHSRGQLATDPHRCSSHRRTWWYWMASSVTRVTGCCRRTRRGAGAVAGDGDGEMGSRPGVATCFRGLVASRNVSSSLTRLITENLANLCHSIQ